MLRPSGRQDEFHAIQIGTAHLSGEVDSILRGPVDPGHVAAFLLNVGGLIRSSAIRGAWCGREV
jgi:hypothetical protein